MTKHQFKTLFLLNEQNMKLINVKHSLKPAAVLIPMVERNNELFVIFTQRALHLRHHPGQISFPGGRFEPSDGHLSHTALRETEEEIGIKNCQVEILGQMGHYRTISDYKVTPFVGFVEPDYQLDIDKNEVKDVFEVPWRFLLQRISHQTFSFLRRNKDINVHFMPYKDKLIWGTTASILDDLITHFE